MHAAAMLYTDPQRERHMVHPRPLSLLVLLILWPLCSASMAQDDLTIIVVDNDGGGIFSTLGQRGSKGFETIFGTPHGIDIASVVKSFGISTQQISSAKELHIALQQILNGSLPLHQVPNG